jgi:hypothetical protein
MKTEAGYRSLVKELDTGVDVGAAYERWRQELNICSG